jgi:hypothetical protein
MTIPSFGNKQPYEEYYVSFNFSNDLTSGEITSAVVTVEDENGADVTSSIVSNTFINGGCRVFAFVKGGTEQTYKMTCKIVCSNTEKYEKEAYLPVSDV